MNNKKIFISALILFSIGAFFHFVYDWVRVPFIAWLFPVNESIFEHTKLIVTPLSIYYFCNMIKNPNDTKKIFFELNLSILFGMFFMITIYYTVFGIFGKDFKIFNILILLISLLISLYISMHISKYKKLEIKHSLIIYLSLILYIIVMTYYPFKIPFFYDFSTFKYGI